MIHAVKVYTGGLKDLDEKGYVRFYFNSFGVVDSDGDMTKAGAFAKTINDNKGRIKHFKNHNIYQSPGVIKELGEDAVGAWAGSQLIMGTQLGRETYEEYKAGAITEHSFGYDVIKSAKNPAGHNDLLELKVWEVSSLNAWGANSQTPMIDLKNEKELFSYLEMLTKLAKGDFTDDYLERVEQRIKDISQHLSTLRSTTSRKPENEPLNAAYFLNNLKLLK